MSRFAWRDLMSVDPDASTAFFTALFGWTELPVESAGGAAGAYRQLLNGDELIGGVLPLDPALGHPSHWVSAIDVANLEATVARAARLGGAVASPPSDVPGLGRIAALTDQQGALFCALEWSPAAIRPPERPESPGTGSVAWNELLTADPGGAAAFYAKLFHWGQRAGGSGRLLLRDGQAEAGVVKRLPSMAVSAWLVAFAVADLEASLTHVRELGGRVVTEPAEDGRGHRFAYAADPTEAGFGLIQSGESADA
jgi:predicted enzyme related to lactoylglutathione lyase